MCRHVVLALVAAGALAACSKDDSPSGPPPPGCNQVSLNWTCYSDPAATSATCAAEGGAWAPGGCPGAAMSGICVGATGRTTYFYYSATDWMSYATHDASSSCELEGGSFVPAGALVRASCDAPSYSACADFSGTESDMQAYPGTLVCGILSGTWSTTAPCTSSGLRGTCSYVTSSGVEIQERYYYATTAAAASCTDPGDTWTPN